MYIYIYIIYCIYIYIYIYIISNVSMTYSAIYYFAIFLYSHFKEINGKYDKQWKYSVNFPSKVHQRTGWSAIVKLGKTWKNIWLVVLTILKNISQWEGFIPYIMHIKHVWNHQPDIFWRMAHYPKHFYLGEGWDQPSKSTSTNLEDSR